MACSRFYKSYYFTTKIALQQCWKVALLEVMSQLQILRRRRANCNFEAVLGPPGQTFSLGCYLVNLLPI